MTRKGEFNWKSKSFEQRRNKYVFSLFLNTDSDEADVTSLGRPFHTFAPATGKARPPVVERRQVGMSGCSVKADLSLRRCGMSATHVNDDAKSGGAAEPCPIHTATPDTTKQSCLCRVRRAV